MHNMIYTREPEYERNFWNAMRGKGKAIADIDKGLNKDTGTFALPNAADNDYAKAIIVESLFRQIATTAKAYDTSFTIFAKYCSDLAKFVPENGNIPIYESADDFTPYKIENWKLAALIKCDEDFVHDAAFDFKKYLVTRLARNFGKAETSGFITGTGDHMPTGILHDTAGAEIGTETSSLTYDDIIKLYFSVKDEYRSKAVWLMNDKTAMTLRTIKDSAGNYLWRSIDDTIFSKKIIISEFMPDIAKGNKPIAFGDFSYYWVVERRTISVRPIYEKFAANNQIGYLAIEFLDGKLIRPEAIKVIQIS